MPLPVIAPAIAAAGIGLLGQGINAVTQGSMNRKTRKWSEKQYAKQRADSLSDWALQNSYNHPSAQMARLREAGLNPNLVYGNGADATGGPVRGTEVQAWRPDAAQFDLGSVAHGGLAAYYDTQVKQAQIDLTRKQMDRIDTENLATLAGIDLTKANTKRSEFQLALDNQIRDITIGQHQADLDKTLADTKYTLNQDERAKAMNASSLQEAAERILRSRAERTKIPLERQEILARIEALKKDTQLKQTDLNLKEKGIQPGDNLFMRILGQMLDNPKELRDKYGLKLTDKFKKWNLNPTPFK